MYASDILAKEQSYGELEQLLRHVSPSDKLLVLGDFNARVGREHQLWPSVMGKHSYGVTSTNGEMILQLCATIGLTIANTLFELKDQYKVTWMHPRSKKWHVLDYALVRAADRSDVLSARVKCGAECSTDHRLLVVSLRFQLRHKE